MFLLSAMFLLTTEPIKFFILEKLHIGPEIVWAMLFFNWGLGIWYFSGSTHPYKAPRYKERIPKLFYKFYHVVAPCIYAPINAGSEKTLSCLLH